MHLCKVDYSDSVVSMVIFCKLTFGRKNDMAASSQDSTSQEANHSHPVSVHIYTDMNVRDKNRRLKMKLLEGFRANVFCFIIFLPSITSRRPRLDTNSQIAPCRCNAHASYEDRKKKHNGIMSRVNTQNPEASTVVSVHWISLPPFMNTD